MSGGTFVRHDCGRLIIYGQRCVCDPVALHDCDCTSAGNYEHEGAHCKEMRRRAWSRIFDWAPGGVS